MGKLNRVDRAPVFAIDSAFTSATRPVLVMLVGTDDPDSELSFLKWLIDLSQKKRDQITRPPKVA
jgi:hypothetical protein